MARPTGSSRSIPSRRWRWPARRPARPARSRSIRIRRTASTPITGRATAPRTPSTAGPACSPGSSSTVPPDPRIMAVVELEGLTKRFGDAVALDGLSLSIRARLAASLHLRPYAEGLGPVDAAVSAGETHARDGQPSPVFEKIALLEADRP